MELSRDNETNNKQDKVKNPRPVGRRRTAVGYFTKEGLDLKTGLTSQSKSSWHSGRRGRSRGWVQGVRTPPPHPPSEMTCGFLIQLVFCKKKKKETIWFIGVEVEQETSAPPPKKNPGSAPGAGLELRNSGL